MVRTLWGELAWQLGGKKAFARVAADDEKATSPGDVLRELFNEYGPCLILIDEWVAYARQLHDQSDLPAGGFETQFTFAQALTESAKLAKQLPARRSACRPRTPQARRTRRPTMWRWVACAGARRSTGCATWSGGSSRRGGRRRAEEGFEIVRRRLFEPLAEPTQFKDRDVAARAFADLYRTQQPEFPPECRDADYEKRMQAAYPIHPEIFDRLYTDWSTLVKFQRTRGVLRLMAAVIHSLWEKGDRNPLILPANIPIDDPRVQSELTRYLSDNWAPIIEKDVDGPNSLPLRIDGEQPNLGKLAATRRVARTIYLGSAPTTAAAHRGLEDRRVKLGCVMPGESPAVFGDALRRLAGSGDLPLPGRAALLVLHAADGHQARRGPRRAAQARPGQGGARSSTSACAPTCARRATSSRIHPLPQLGRRRARRPRRAAGRAWRRTTRTARSPATRPRRRPRRSSSRAATRRASTATRWCSSPPTRRGCRTWTRRCARYLAWESILAEKETLDLDPHQVRQAETQKTAADGAVTARLPETYQWLLVPTQANPQAAVAWQAIRLSGQDALAVRASKKLRSDELLVTSFGGHAAAHGARPRAAVARRPRRDQAARRGLRALSLPAASEGCRRCCSARSATAAPC